MKLLSKIKNIFDKISVINPYLFIFAYTLIVASDLFNDIFQYAPILQVFDYISVLLLSIIIFVNLIKSGFVIKREKWILFVFAILIFVSAYFSNDRTLLKLPFLLIAFEDMDFNTFIKRDFVIRVSLVFFMALLISFGPVNNVLLEIRNGLTRYYFGTGHPNAFGLYLFFILLDYMYIQHVNGKKNRIMNIIISVIFATFIYLFIGSRTCIALIVMINLIFLFKDKIVINNKIVKIGICCVFLLLFGLSVLSGYLYKTDNKLVGIMDTVLSGRISYAHIFLLNYKFSILGKHVTTGFHMILDNAYVSIYLRYGIIVSIMFIYAFYNMFNKLLSNKKYLLVFIMIVVAILGLTECAMYVPAKTPFLLLLAYPLMIQKEEKNEKK